MSWWVWLLYFGVFVALTILITVLLRHGHPVQRKGVPATAQGFGDATVRPDGKAGPDTNEGSAALPGSHVHIQPEPATATPPGAPATPGATSPEGTPPSQWAATADKTPAPPQPATAAYAEAASASASASADDSANEMPAIPVQSGNLIVRGPYGNGSATPLPDGSVPAGYPIKGNAGSMRYHTKDSPSYDDTKASVFFRTEGSALFAGFRPWNWRSNSDTPGTDLPGQRDADQPPAPYGKGSAAPLADGSAPEGFTIKGKSGSMLFHSEASPYYRRTKAEAWFRTEEAAVAAGFKPWNWRKRRD